MKPLVSLVYSFYLEDSYDIGYIVHKDIFWTHLTIKFSNPLVWLCNPQGYHHSSGRDLGGIRCNTQTPPREQAWYLTGAPEESWRSSREYRLNLPYPESLPSKLHSNIIGGLVRSCLGSKKDKNPLDTLGLYHAAVTSIFKFFTTSFSLP